MYISKKDREIIRLKFNGRCAYTGTRLKKDWQVEHIKPLMRNWGTNTVRFPDAHVMDNMVPVQRIANHYKGGLDLETFRTWLLGGLHERLKKVPKKPRTKESKRRKKYIMEVAKLFNIAIDKPFSGRFYFETVTNSLN